MSSNTSSAPLSVPAAAERSSASATPKTGSSRTRITVGIILGAAAIIWGARTGLHAYHYVETDDAYVTGHLHQVSAQLDGQVKEVLVQDNQNVKAGDILLRLDPLETEISSQKADAGLAQAQAQEKQLIAAIAQSAAALVEARARVTQAEAQVEQTTAQLDLAKRTLERNQQLFARNGAVPEADLDNARSAQLTAQGAVDAAKANLAAAKASVGSAEAAQNAQRAEADAAHASVGAALAAQRDAQRRLAQTSIVATTAGRIGNKRVELGNRVQAGQTLLTLAEPEMWVVANFKETQLTRITAGQPVDLSVDALPGTDLHGHVDSVAPASGAQFALLPPDNATGNFNKVVQRVPVKIVLDDASRTALADHLRLGLSVVAEVRVR